MSTDDPATTPGNDARPSQRSPKHPPVDFTTLVLSIHEGALELLGVKGEADTPDLPAAHHQIDLLAMLQDKTSGNLSDDEDRLLRTVLYELRTAYVRIKDT